MRIRLTLKARFILVAGGAVAAVALAITAVAFLAIRTDLQNQVRQQVAARADSVRHLAAKYHGHIPNGWVPAHSAGVGILTYTQIVTETGAVWAPPGDLGLLAPSATALAVARGSAAGTGKGAAGTGENTASFYSVARINGIRAEVLTEQLAPGLAIQVADPLTATDQEVAAVGTTLALLSVVGVLTATLLGWAVARAGLAPVTRLASVAEEVTLTGDPGRRVEVRRRDELGRLATSFNAMLSALQRSLDAQRRLVSDASHELRTPLASLRLNADLLAAHPEMPAAERAEVLGRITGQAAELSRLVASVTDLARGEPPPKDRSQVRLDVVTADALDAARRDWPETEFDADLAACTVDGSADRLRVAVRNLLDNAAKFGPPEGAIEVRLTDGELTVRDHGPGIDPDDLPFVFDRFYRALSSRAAPGSGLGLAVVREIARGHGGEVAAEPAQGGGTLMRLTIPTSPAVGSGGLQEPHQTSGQEIMAARSGASLRRPGARVSAAAARGNSSWE
ncbi:MAG: HAMP domain-containing sensor histidine kinase [Trebonia sp.]|jgi:two-component system sensor histidine kinase MprB